MTCGFSSWPAHWLTHRQPPAQFPGEGPAGQWATGEGGRQAIYKKEKSLLPRPKAPERPVGGGGRTSSLSSPPGPGPLGMREAWAQTPQPDAGLQPRAWAVPRC